MKTRYKIAFLVAAVVFLIFLPHTGVVDKVQNSFSQSTVLNKESEKVEEKAEPEKIDREPFKTKLLADIQTQLSTNNQFAVSIYDINNGESFGINETGSFHSASVTKLLVATAVFEEIEKGKYTLETPLGGSTIKYHLQQMINQSNNNSWDYFNNLLGFKREQETADRLSLTGVNMFQTHMTTKGVSELLLKLYKAQATNTQNRDLLFSFMQNTETENRISPAIPAGVNFYHKTGSYEGGLHDAAIVINPKNPFILVIFTNDSKGIAWEARFSGMTNTARLTNEYFNSI